MSFEVLAETTDDKAQAALRRVLGATQQLGCSVCWLQDFDYFLCDFAGKNIFCLI